MKKYPKTEVVPVSETIRGKKLTDNYRWLEDASNPKVQQWIKTQNEFTDSIIDEHGSGSKETFLRELDKMMHLRLTTDPVPYNGRYFWEEQQPDEDQFVLYWRQGLNGKPKVIFNPNGQTQDNTISLDYSSVSNSGKYIAYGLSEGGTEISTMHIQEVESGKQFETIPFTRYTRVKWLPDDSGFYYTRLPKPGTVPKGEETYHGKLYFHLVGTDPENDPMIFGKDRPKEESYGMTLSEDGQYLLISGTDNWTSNKVWLYDTISKKLTTIIDNIEATFSINQVKGKIYSLTNYRASNSRVLVADLANLPKSIDDWEEFIPEKDNSIDNIYLTADKIMAEYLVDVCSQVITYDYSGQETGQLPLAELSSLVGIAVRREEREFFFSTSNFLNSKTMYRYNPETDNYEISMQPLLSLDPKKFEAHQEWFKSTDGVKVPIFIIHKRA